MRVSSLRSLKENYKNVINFLSDFQSNDLSSVCKADSFLRKMCSFDFLFFLNMAIELLSPIELLNTALQAPKLSVVCSNKKVTTVISVLQTSMTTAFTDIWEESLRGRNNLDGVEEPKLPRGYRSVKQTVDSYYKEITHKCFENTLKAFNDRFNNAGTKLYVTLERVATNSNSEEERQAFEEAYKEDFAMKDFYAQRKFLFAGAKLKGSNIMDLDSLLDFCESFELNLCPEFAKLIILILTIPGTSCSNERSFVILRRLKSYLRTTMVPERLNNLAILNHYKGAARKLDLEKLVDEFILKTECRQRNVALSTSM